jgi:P-type conjugative transfer protein TrbL
MALDSATTVDGLVQAFTNKGPAVQAALLNGAHDLFAGLAVIELVWFIGWSVANKTDIFDIMIVVVRLAIGFGFWLWMMTNWVQMAAAIIQTYGLWGNAAVQAAGGTANLAPLGFFQSGLDLCKALWQVHFWSDPGVAVILILTGLICIGIFGYIASVIVLVVVESALASYLGTINMAFNACSFTRDFGFAPIKYALSVGMKRMTLQFIAGLAQASVTAWVNALNGAVPTSLDCAILLGGCALFVTLAAIAPKIAQDTMMGSHLSTGQGIAQSSRQIASAVMQLTTSLAGGGAAGIAAAQLAGRQMAARTASGTAPASAAARAATIAGLMAKNAASGVASDVGKRLSGNYVASHGYRGFRVAADLNKKS